MGDLLASAINPNVGAWPLSPMASEIEAQNVRWIAEMVGYPTNCGGLFHPIQPLPAAPQGSRRGWPCFRREQHTWIQKAADISGMGTDAIRWIAVDDECRIDRGALRDQIKTDIAAGDRPMLVVGTASTVSTGAVDPLPELAVLCREFDLWFHVDGAYGALAAVLPDAPSALAAMHEADSAAVDPHKWLHAPLEAGCALVRHPPLLRDAFAYHPPYYHFGTEAINYFDLGPQNSRGFRSLKVWLALQQAGRAGYIEMIRKDTALAAELFEQVRRFPEL